jgi:hypothetical protein
MFCPNNSTLKTGVLVCGDLERFFLRHIRGDSPYNSPGVVCGRVGLFIKG